MLTARMARKSPTIQSVQVIEEEEEIELIHPNTRWAMPNGETHVLESNTPSKPHDSN